jgi:2-haloacid dehalogenase
MHAAELRALVFDAYGTIYDVASVQETCVRHFGDKGRALTDLWRVKQLEYTWLRSLMGEYEDFQAITEAGLRAACRALALELVEPARRDLMDHYFRLRPYAEVPLALERLARKRPLAILSNGSPAMLARVTEHNGLSARFRYILSVDTVKVFKPSPKVYELAVKAFGVGPEAIGFVSSNYWDAVGAKACGFHVFWINRFRRPREELGHDPDREVFTMDQVADIAESGP